MPTTAKSRDGKQITATNVLTRVDGDHATWQMTRLTAGRQADARPLLATGGRRRRPLQLGQHIGEATRHASRPSDSRVTRAAGRALEFFLPIRGASQIY
jgi:hypothetical protein